MKITVISTGFNPPDKGRRCIESVGWQKNVDFEHIVIDAAKQSPSKEHFENLIDVIYKLPHEQIVACVDLDDWLTHGNVLRTVCDAHENGALLTYGSFMFQSGVRGFAEQYSKQEWNNLRKIRWRATHLKTFRAGLFKNISQGSFFIGGKYIQHARDQALMFPMIEMAGYDRCKFIPEILYVYNIDSSTHASMTDAEKQDEENVRIAICDMYPYTKLNERALDRISGNKLVNQQSISDIPTTHKTTHKTEKMKHFYESIPGYFTFADFYTWLAEDLKERTENPHVVEVGCCYGRSAAFLGVELINRFKPDHARLDLVDLFQNGKTASDVLRDLNPIVGAIGKLYAGLSWEMASHYTDCSLDAVFIDADHTYNSVSKDIDAWLPKVKIGGVIAGHDYTNYNLNGIEFGVIKAVNERFKRFEVWPGSLYESDDIMNGQFWPVWSARIYGLENAWCSLSKWSLQETDKKLLGLKTTEELIAASSLGTEEVLKMRQSVPKYMVDKILARVDELDELEKRQRKNVTVAKEILTQIEEMKENKLVVPQPVSKDPSEIYTRKWFEDNYINDPEQIPAWEIIADAIVKIFQPNTVIDIGCGPGLLVNALRMRDIYAFGVDGSIHAINAAPKEIRRHLTISDVTKQVTLKLLSEVNLVTCTEVAEHIEEKYAYNFVDHLTNYESKYIVLTAAPKGQGGTDHVNEQPPEYWISKFDKRGYVVNHTYTNELKKLWKPAERLWFLAKNVIVFEKVAT
jgi:SAM-dependent methyltransferase